MKRAVKRTIKRAMKGTMQPDDPPRRDWLRAAGRAATAAIAATGTLPGGADVPTERPAPAARVAADGSFSFGFIGDTPYNGADERALSNVMAAMDDAPLSFVLHVGDIKSSDETCSDALLSDRLARLDRSRHPLVLTPGDNEWTDCAPSRPPDSEGGALERLDWLRRQVYARPRTLGATGLAVSAQGGLAQAAGDPPRLPENLRWRIGDVQFCTLHVVGSNNGHLRAPALRRDWSVRQQANGRWLADTVALARAGGARALVIAMHANLRFGRDRADGWQPMRQLIAAAAAAFDGPVLLLHGDTHWFRVDRPLAATPELANLLRVECFGSPFSASWVSIRWNPAALSAPAGPAGERPAPFVVGTRTT